jgi:hypothetical protein
LGSYEKCRTFNFFHCFWLKIERNLVMADLVSLFEGMCTFFLWKYLILLHFLNLKTPTEDSRLRHGRDFETPFLYRAAVTGLCSVNFFPANFFLVFWKKEIFLSKIVLAGKKLTEQKRLFVWNIDRIVSLCL